MFAVVLYATLLQAAAVETVAHANGFRSRIDVVSGTDHTCLMLGVRVGAAHDPPAQSGMAQAVGAGLRIWTQRHAPDLALNVAVQDTVTWVWTTVHATQAGAVVGSMRRLLAGGADWDDDLCAIALARAKLAADDQTQVIPGHVHRWIARRRLWRSTPRARVGAGLPAEIATIGAPTLRSRLESRYRPGNAFLCILGAADTGLEADVARLGDRPTSVEAAPIQPPARTELPSNEVTNYLADAAHVTAAFRAPPADAPDFAEAMVATTVVHNHVAGQEWAHRGGEFRAAFAAFGYDLFDEPRVVALNRRGPNGADAAVPRRELRDAIDGIGSAGTDRRIAAAAELLSRRLELPPFQRETRESLSRYRQLLYERTRVIASHVAFGWPADLARRVAAVSSDDVRAALGRWFDPAGVEWVTTLPRLAADIDPVLQEWTRGR